MAHVDHTTPAASQSVWTDLGGGGRLTVTEPLAPPDVVVVTVRGEVDGSGCPWLHDRLVARVRSTRHLVVDLGEVSFFGAAGLAVLVVVRAEALVERCRLCVVVRSRVVRLPLIITGLVDEFDLHADVVEALVCSRSPAGSLLGGPRQPGDRR